MTEGPLTLEVHTGWRNEAMATRPTNRNRAIPDTITGMNPIRMSGLTPRWLGT